MGDRKQIKKVTIDDVLFYNMRTVVDPDGNLVPIESNQDTPFPIRRVFYVYGVGDISKRGLHSHYKTKQLLICLSGKIEVTVKDGENEKKFLLESPQQGLYIPELIWDEQVYKNDNSVLLVLSNLKYDPDDYIHDFELFKKIKGFK
jgi:dTDP-4-dehydrorhamnose 3,5-epimerase-like enzyme